MESYGIVAPFIWKSARPKPRSVYWVILPIRSLSAMATLCYLGLHFHESDSVAHLTKPLKAKTAGSRAMVQQKHAQFQCGDTVNLKLSLLQALLMPTVHCGCAVWGMYSPSIALANSARSELQRVYERYLRIICGLQPSTPSAILFAELNPLPLKVYWWRQSFKFWNKLARAPHGSQNHIAGQSARLSTL